MFATSTKQCNYFVAIVVLAGISGAGCLLPFATPPARIQASGIVSSGKTRIKADSVSFSESGFDVRGSFQPLQMSQKLDRRFDIGAGYFGTFRFDDELPNSVQHGIYLDVGAYPWLSGLGRNVKKIGVWAQPELVFSDRERGVGLNLAVSFEWIEFGDGATHASSSDGFTAVSYYGQGGIGFQLSSGYRHVGDERSWLFLGALVIRMPGTIGIIGGIK